MSRSDRPVAVAMLQAGSAGLVARSRPHRAPTVDQDSSGPAISPRMSRLLILGMWLACSIGLIAITWHFIVPLNFRDPDDALRLVQVRDLLGGQSWFDLTQYRIYPPDGVPMHWSRLVDLPVALLLGPLDPLLGQPLAERVVMIAVPLAELLGLALIVYKLARLLALPRGTALLAVAMLLSALSILIQFAPLRIDHHALQILSGAAAMLALVSTASHDGRRGLFAGIALACWMQISIEGLPYAVMAGGIFALHHVLRKDRWADLQAYMLALTLVSALLLFGTHAPAAAIVPWCDSLSPAYLVPLALVTTLMLVGVRIVPGNNAVLRAIPLAIAGGAGAATFVLLSPNCLAGPFETLDPLVYQLWYLAVREGLPISMQKPDLQAIIVVPAIIGLIGSALGLRRAQTPAQREAWINLLLIQAGAFAVALSVMRSMAFAHLVALPGNAVLLAALMGSAQRLRLMPVRVLATAGCCLATPIGASAITAAVLNSETTSAGAAKADEVPDRFRCTTYATLRGLDALPPTLLFTPLDIGAHLLAYTRHSVVATGHHRNSEGMMTVLSGLTSPTDKARAIVLGSGAEYLALCRGENEIGRYRRLYPNSLLTDLMTGKTPAWLQRVPMRPGESILVYRIVRTPAR